MHENAKSNYQCPAVQTKNFPQTIDTADLDHPAIDWHRTATHVPRRQHGLVHHVESRIAQHRIRQVHRVHADQPINLV